MSCLIGGIHVIRVESDGAVQARVNSLCTSLREEDEAASQPYGTKRGRSERLGLLAHFHFRDSAFSTLKSRTLCGYSYYDDVFLTLKGRQRSFLFESEKHCTYA